MQYMSPAAGGFLCGVCMFSLCWCLFLLCFSHNPETYRTGELETVVSVNMNVCDGLAICPGVCHAYDPGKSPASSWPYRTSARENVWKRWMDVKNCDVLVLPLSATLFFHNNVSSLILPFLPVHTVFITNTNLVQTVHLTSKTHSD